MKATVIAVFIAAVLIGGAATLTNNKGGTPPVVNENNVTLVEGKQIVEIRAKGGYLPEKSVAKAGIPTILRFDTNGTFDCSSSVRIPSMDISKILPQAGTTDINIGIQKAGTFSGTCGMGMYPFEVDFQS